MNIRCVDFAVQKCLFLLHATGFPSKWTLAVNQIVKVFLLFVFVKSLSRL